MSVSQSAHSLKRRSSIGPLCGLRSRLWWAKMLTVTRKHFAFQKGDRKQTKSLRSPNIKTISDATAASYPTEGQCHRNDCWLRAILVTDQSFRFFQRRSSKNRIKGGAPTIRLCTVRPSSKKVLPLNLPLPETTRSNSDPTKVVSQTNK